MNLQFLVFFSGIVFANAEDICSIKCYADNYSKCSKGEAAATDSCTGYKSGLSPEEKELIVKVHNEYRQKVAQGTMNRAAQSPFFPEAADMMEVVWDEELASLAQRWADLCEMSIDPCSSTSDGTNFGQNSMTGSGPADMSREKIIQSSVRGWFLEKRNFDVALIGKFSITDDFQRYGRFTQLIWGTATQLGCGFIHKTDKMMHSQELVCYYKPAGNFYNHPIYKAGKACSGCPKGSQCSDTFPGLCKVKSS